MSITWLVLVLPATFAEVIGLSLVTPGRNGYLHVQIYTGCMFIAAFVCRKFEPTRGQEVSSLLWKETYRLANCTPVWTLRIYKLYLMEAAGLTPEEREQDIRNPDAVSLSTRGRSDQQKLSMAFVVKSCFAVTKV